MPMSSSDHTVFIPGSFDPLHLGHVDVIGQAVDLFGRVVVGVLYNRAKSGGLFTPDERRALAEATVADAGIDEVRVMTFDGLAIDGAVEAGADFIVKGLRTAADFEIEQQMAHTNHSVSGMRTVFVPCDPARAFISSRFIREISAQGGRVDHMVGPRVARALSDRFSAPNRP